ncbi:MAG: PHP domain-containing protein [Candidatus Bathyarchaeota archaeon]
MGYIDDKVDLHIHTTFSDGRSSIQEVISVGRLKGIKVMAITDHYNEFFKVSNRFSRDQLAYYLSALEGTGVLKGVETDIFEDGSISISKSTAEFMDLVIGGLHVLHGVFFWYDTKPILNPAAFVEDTRITLIKAMETGLLNIIAHVTWLPESIRPQTGSLVTKEWIKSVVKAACDNSVAIELSGAWKVPDEDFARECVHQGAMLSAGSDAHSARMVGHVEYSFELMKRIEAPPNFLFIPKPKF